MVDNYFGRFLTLPGMREMSVAEQRYQAVMAMIAEGRTVTEVAAQCKAVWAVVASPIYASNTSLDGGTEDERGAVYWAPPAATSAVSRTNGLRTVLRSAEERGFNG